MSGAPPAAATLSTDCQTRTIGALYDNDTFLKVWLAQ